MLLTDLTPNNTIAELLAAYPVAARVLVGHRMHCVGCDIARFETIADACTIYDVAVHDLLGEIHREGNNGGQHMTTMTSTPTDAVEHDCRN
jgi:hybrid cluster-associated redox disulfide protein